MNIYDVVTSVAGWSENKVHERKSSFTRPIDADVVSRSGVGQRSFDHVTHTPVDFLERQHAFEQRKGGFDQHSLVPVPARA